MSQASLGLGSLALGSLFGCNPTSKTAANGTTGSILSAPHFAPKAKRIIYLFQSGGPSQIDLFDHKPLLMKMRGEELPDSIRQGQRLTGMTSGQSSLPLAPAIFDSSFRNRK